MAANEQEITPRSNTFLLGQEEAEGILLEAYKNNSLHNSWLICGVEGIGKATLAYKFARFLLEPNKPDTLNIPSSSHTFKLVENNAHPNMKIIERDFIDTEKRKIIKAIKDGDPLSQEELSSMKKSSVIRVDDVRTINEFLSKRSSNDGWRVVLVDSIDDMNGASANAILKILEEPPYKTIILLISHNPNKLLPTIKSRCAKLVMKPLEENTLATLLRRYRPDVSEKDIKVITKICSGSIGKAINYVDNDAVKRYDNLCKIIYAKDKFSINELLSFAEDAARNEDIYNLSKDLILKFISENVKSTDNPEELSKVWDKAISTFVETEGLNLDKKQALINIITNICKVI